MKEIASNFLTPPTASASFVCCKPLPPGSPSTQPTVAWTPQVSSFCPLPSQCKS